jgi:hypothetical protein
MALITVVGITWFLDFIQKNKPVTMYHGTSRSKAKSITRTGKFRPSADGMLGAGVHMSRDIRKAEAYAPGGVVFELEVRLGRVATIDCQGHALQKTWQVRGYDAAEVPAGCGMVRSGLTETCVSDPARIQVVKQIKMYPANQYCQIM